ncbi:hypothetical protein HCJ92_19070 [Streptomyces sp. ventii]|uniref:Uncharacterized protein n=2 Tax=Streptomyces spiramenti TaxID=2720606 RepID=A0ABX1ASC9_9ACTN|nr:hypothetical protein [Streptomyces spiramenti]
MTRLSLADQTDAAGLAAFLTRQLKWDRAAAVRLRASGDGVLAAFGRPARFEVLAVRTSRLVPTVADADADADADVGPAEDVPGATAASSSPGPAPAAGPPAELDATVSAGQLLDGIDEQTATLTVPPPVTGPSWAGMLPPRGQWRRVAEPSLAEVRAEAGAVVAEFRSRSEALRHTERTRAALDALAEEIWNRPLPGTSLPLRAVHAAHALGFLQPVGGVPVDEVPVPVLAAGPWLRLRTPHGSTAVRGAGRPGLSLTPL